MSDNGVPDLGGINNEETFFADEVCQQGDIICGLYHYLRPSPWFCFFVGLSR